MAKQDKNIKSALSNINKLKKQNTTKKSPETKGIVQEVKKKKPVGRPSVKDPSIKYIKLSASIPEDTKMEMKIALFSIFRNKHKTQDDFIDAAILYYIDNHK